MKPFCYETGRRTMEEPKNTSKSQLFFDLTTESSDWSPHSSIYRESIKVDLGPER
jgi:hypothetical protein